MKLRATDNGVEMMRDGDADWVVILTRGKLAHAMGEWVFMRPKADALLQLVAEAISNPPSPKDKVA